MTTVTFRGSVADWLWDLVIRHGRGRATHTDACCQAMHEFLRDPSDLGVSAGAGFCQ